MLFCPEEKAQDEIKRFPFGSQFYPLLMIQRIKLFVLKMISAYGNLRLVCKGVVCGAGCIIHGTPKVKKKRGSAIVLGDGVKLCSLSWINPMVTSPCYFATLSSAAKIEVGNHCGISGTLLYAEKQISIGEYTIIGAQTVIFDMLGHQYSKTTGWSAASRDNTSMPIFIGKRCYIGMRCTILPGARIGDDCVIAAGTIVSSGVPDGHRAWGNPMVCEPLPKALGGPGRRKKDIV